MNDTDYGIDHAKHFESFKAQALCKLLTSDYKPVDTKDVIFAQHRLSKSQKQLLATVLDRQTELFDGKLGRYPNYLDHIISRRNSAIDCRK